jgi:UDP-N-acetylmuramate--alanine ligase
MAHSFEDADQVLVTTIFAARESDDGTVSAQDIVDASPHPAIWHSGGLVESAEYLVDRVESGDVVLVLGAGDSYRIGELLLAHLGDQPKIDHSQETSAGS